MVPAAAILLLALMGVSAGSPALASSGRTTFYGGAPDGMSPYNPSYGTSEGSCGYGLLDRGSWSVGAVAVGDRAYGGPTFGCGSCWKLTCKDGGCTSPGASVVITITDSCPECKSKNGADFDIQALSFAKIANPSAGSVAIDYEQVSCSGGSPLANVLDNRGAGGWARFGVEGMGGIGEVASISVNGVSATHTWGAIFEVHSMPGTGPYDLHVTLADGSSVSCPGAFSAGQKGKIPMSCGGGGGGSTPQPSLTPSPTPSPTSSPTPSPSPSPSPSLELRAPTRNDRIAAASSIAAATQAAAAAQAAASAQAALDARKVQAADAAAAVQAAKVEAMAVKMAALHAALAVKTAARMKVINAAKAKAAAIAAHTARIKAMWVAAAKKKAALKAAVKAKWVALNKARLAAKAAAAHKAKMKALWRAKAKAAAAKKLAVEAKWRAMAKVRAAKKDAAAKKVADAKKAAAVAAKAAAAAKAASAKALAAKQFAATSAAASTAGSLLLSVCIAAVAAAVIYV